MNNKLSILEILHADLKELKSSLNFSQSQVAMGQLENNELKETVKTLTTHHQPC